MPLLQPLAMRSSLTLSSAPFPSLSLSLSLSLFAAAPADAQPSGSRRFEPESAVAVVVKLPKPWYATKAIVVSRMRETVAQYASVPGLAYKAYSVAQADGQYGGLYLWKNEASARAFFGPAWFERVERERGVKAQVQFYEVPVVIDNTNGPAGDDGAAVGTVVTLAVPAGITKARLVEEFRAAIPQYRRVPGLLRKYFTVTEDGKFGGIYLWKDAASAQQWFTEAWKDRVLKTYGTQATIEWFDTPILLPSALADNQLSIPGL